MSQIHKSYRINTNVGADLNADYITLDANLVQDYDTFDILSVKIDSVDTYKLHNANYGVVVGRVIANNGFGIPNAKLSIFISSDGEDGDKVRDLYPFTSTASKDRKGVRYNLLPNEQVDDCHQIVGTFPNKRYALDNDVVLEVFDKYYKYTTRTNNAGDYLIMGVPVGTHTLHMDLDLSDCGILSQRPRDFVYKGYTIEQFENPNMFKEGTAYSNLSQIFTQDQVVNVQPFWGNASLGEKIGITRADIDVAFKFEPTCVFMGSVVSDNSSQGISKKCIATENMGNMEELTTGEGTIEMIRKTVGGSIEEFQVKGTQLIDGNGIWCYQIPMNLDYMMTDEYGNMVPTDDPEKGIPTRTRVRFRISMQDNEENVDNYFRAKVLVPHNPQNLDNSKYEEYDYEFGSLTREDSFRDLFWNNVYSVKSYIPRFQKRKVGGWKEKKFTGIKNCNFYGTNNPMPYNNIRIKLPFMFTVMCALIKVFIFIVSIMNTLTSMLGNFLSDLGDTYIGFRIGKWDIGFYPFKNLYEQALGLSMNVLKEGLCPDLENWYFAPMFRANLWSPPKEPPKDMPRYDLLKQTLEKIRKSSADDDPESIDVQNNEETGEEGNTDEPICLTIRTDYLIACIEMNLAMEYKVINFDFYNDWVNGTIYFPRFMRYIRPKRTFLGITFVKSKIKGCMDDTKIFSKTRRYTQQCSLSYKAQSIEGKDVYTGVENPLANNRNFKAANNLHKQRGLSQKTIFGKNGGICHEHPTMKGQKVYYMKPCEWTLGTTPAARKVNLYATDIILLGSLNSCDNNGVPQAFKYLSSTSYIMPTNLALTNMETNGWLYATDKGTICAGKSYLSEDDVRRESKVTVVNPNSGLTTEILAYSGAQDSNYDVKYDGNELSDIIALTEAAGIAWNYTGPGQGEVNPQNLYYPGGHFLGLTCVNSQTNIKSCINLSRICEVGANMSQRKEDISLIENKSVKYTYTVPTGFISGDDIVGANFRTMFATMNYNRLLATKTNPQTGYKIYDFEFLKPINFDGTFKSVITNNENYNSKIEIPIESPEIFTAVGIAAGSNGRDDYDEGEISRTQTRTIEDTSIDYYLFRFGLTYEELKKSNQKQMRRFLLTDGNKMYLPQFENSYYFYFGLKNGATAIDEFNKQFFSECENGKLIAGEPIVNVSIEGDINVCEAKANIIVSTTNLEIPYKYIEYYRDGIDTEPTVIDETNDAEGILNSYFFTLKDKEFGNYVITIRDANDVEFTQKAKIGTNLASFESVAYDFNTDDGSDVAGSLMHRGGYIIISNLSVDGVPSGLSLVLKKGNSEVKEEDYEDSKKLEIPEPNISYGLYVRYSCSGHTQDIFLQEVLLKDGSGLELYMGSPDIDGCKSGLTVSEYGYSTQWWDPSNEYTWLEKICTFNEIKDRGTKTFSNRVFAVGGTKVVWGLPQNKENILVGKTFSTENNTGMTAGYIVDDDYSYHPTLTYDGNPITHYSALVYNGSLVMGKPTAYKKDGSLGGSLGDFGGGYGYILKPLPDGDLEFLEGIPGSDSYDNCLYYPSVVYPVVKRPFYAEADFYIWQSRQIEVMIDEDGSENPMVVDWEVSGKVECNVHNGITYEKYFGKNSKIGFYNDDIMSTRSDLFGVMANIDRETMKEDYPKFQNTEIGKNHYYSTGHTDMLSVGFIIQGGYNTDAEAQLVNTINDSINVDFCDYIAYTTSGNNNVTGYQAIRTETDRGSYFLCKQTGNLIIRKDDDGKEKYITSQRGNNTFYVLCTYTSAATYNVEGSLVIAKITLGGTSSAKFDLAKSDETVYTKEYIKSVNTIEDMLNECPEIKGVRKYRINSALTESDIWKNIIDSDKKAFNGVIDEDGIYYAVGVISGTNGATLYKIFPDLVKVSKFKEEDPVEFRVSATTIDVEMNETDVTITIWASSTKKWYSESRADWLSVSPTEAVGNPNGAEVTIKVKANGGVKDREGTIIFYTTNVDEGITVTIRQTKNGLEDTVNGLEDTVNDLDKEVGDLGNKVDSMGQGGTEGGEGGESGETT